MCPVLPPGPDQAPAIQMLRWFYRPIAFLEDCRRRYGEAFSVSFVGFKSPMVLFSDPAAVKAVYSDQRNGLPPGRNVALEPMLGSRSVLLLEGREHLTRRRLMLPPFHGERMRAYEAIVRDAVAREVATWPAGEPFALHPRMQRVTLEVILRAVFGVTDAGRRERLGERLARLLADTASVGLQFGVLLSRRLGAPDPLERLATQREEIDRMLDAEI